MSLVIQRGKKARAQRVIIYAPEGLGKSTLASQLPNPIFLDFERGTHHLDVARIEPQSWTETLKTLDELKKAGEFDTVVIDTIDWLEEACQTALCQQGKVASIEDFGYGKGYVMMAEQMTVLLQRCDELTTVGKHVVFLAHSEVKRQELPDQPAFDRYQLKLSKKVSPLVKEWADAVLFGNWKTVVREEKGQTSKGVGGKERELNCGHSATADAKNRHGLADREKWGVETMMKIFGAGSADKSTLTGPVAPRGTVNSAVGKAETFQPQTSLGKSGAAGPPSPPVDTCPTAGSSPMPTSPTGASDPIPFLEEKEPMREPWLEALCGPHEAAINKFLRNRGEITEAQSWKSMSSQYAARIQKNPTAFLNAINA